eukprot:403372154
MSGHSHHQEHHSTQQLDSNYQQQFRTYFSKTHKTPALVGVRAQNQYIWVYARNGFEQGAVFGGSLGLLYSIYTRRLMHIPISALGFGVTYAAFHASSAYFRNEI